MLHSCGQKFGVQIYSCAVHGDHIHLSIRIHNREAYKKWIRAATSVLVKRIPKLKFHLRPWSRIIEWGRAFKNVLRYIEFNQREAEFMLSAIKTVERFRWLTPIANF